MIALGVLLIAISYVIYPHNEVAGLSPAVGQKLPTLRLVAIPVPSPHTTQPSARKSNFKNSATPEPEAYTVWDWTDCHQPQVRIIHFWGTWCAPCRQELPDLAELHNELAHRPDFSFVPVTCATFDDNSLETLSERTSQFYSAANINLPTFADPTTAARRQLLDLLQQDSMAYPTTVLVDRCGTIRATWIGVPPGGVATIRRRVQQLLDQVPLQHPINNH